MDFQRRFVKIADDEYNFLKRDANRKLFFAAFNFIVLVGTVFFGVAQISNDEVLSYTTYGLLSSLALLTLANIIYFFFSWTVCSKQLNFKRHYDAVTGSWNSGYFTSMLEDEVRRAGRYKHALTLCIIELDNHDSLVKHFGDSKGKDLLKQFSRFIQERIRATDLFARGNEAGFYLLLPHTELVKSEKVLGRLLVEAKETLDCSCSAGNSSFAAGETSTAFLARTKSALAEAQKKGGARIQCVVSHGRTQVSLEF